MASTFSESTKKVKILGTVLYTFPQRKINTHFYFKDLNDCVSIIQKHINNESVSEHIIQEIDDKINSFQENYREEMNRYKFSPHVKKKVKEFIDTSKEGVIVLEEKLDTKEKAA